MTDENAIARVWLEQFNAALAEHDWDRASRMVRSDGYWRDLLSFGWKFRTCQGPAAIADALGREFPAAGGSALWLEGAAFRGRLGHFGETVEFFIGFETEVATGRGYVRLTRDPHGDGSKAFTLLTALQDLKAFPERNRMQKRRAEPPVPERGVQNWADQRARARAYHDRDPQVLVIGAGMAGLMVAARLGQLDVDTLIVDAQERVGDVWRKRYHSLTLHNETCTNHFPYLPFPDTWPVYVPKDKLAGWMEFYAEAMELNVWQRSVFLGGEYGVDGRWTARIRQADGSIRVMRPAHIVLGTGVSGVANIPDFPGLSTFRGPVVHSSGETDSYDVAGQRVLVVGSGTSGHDVAQDLYLRGAEVTMLQRSPTIVVSLEPSSIRVHELYKRNEGVRKLEDTDLMAAATPFDLVRRLQGPLSRDMQEADRELLDGLRAVGFLLDNGEDDTGYFMKLLRYQAGYYLNVGASDLLIARKIGLKSGVGIARVTEGGVVFTDGTEMELDMLVMATGYKPLQEGVRALFGDVVAERVGPIWGIAPDGEQYNMFQPTAQPGLYIAGGGFMGCRAYTHYTARHIKACLEGLIDTPAVVRESVAAE